MIKKVAKLRKAFVGEKLNLIKDTSIISDDGTSGLGSIKLPKGTEVEVIKLDFIEDDENFLIRIFVKTKKDEKGYFEMKNDNKTKYFMKDLFGVE